MNSRRTVKPGMGIATILLIFVVLVMTIVSVLSLLRVRQNHESIHSQIEYAQAYSQANAKAEYLQDQVKKGNTEDVQKEPKGYTYVIDIMNGQTLHVVLDERGNALEWKTEYEREE